MLEKSQRSRDVGNHEVNGEPMRLPRIPGQFHYIEHKDTRRDYQTLTDFQAIDSSQNVYGIGAENRQHSHVHVVQEP